MKWSDFYKQYLERVAAAPVISQSPVVERLGIMITASLFYEEGRLDKAGFDSVQRIVRTYQTIEDPAANMLARNALVRAWNTRLRDFPSPGCNRRRIVRSESHRQAVAPRIGGAQIPVLQPVRDLAQRRRCSLRGASSRVSRAARSAIVVSGHSSSNVTSRPCTMRKRGPSIAPWGPRP